MKILLIGAGAVGSVISKYLYKDDEVAEVICASNNMNRAKEFISDGGKIKLVELNASNIDEIVDKARGVDLIINASLPRFNENILEAALRVGAHYQDLASELADLKTAEQLKFAEKFKKAGLTALINTGVAPGITNLLAREAADKLNEIEAIHFRCVEEQKASEFIFAWSAETTLDDLTMPPLVYRDGKFILTKPFGDSEEYEFPEPFGKRRVFSIYGDEVATVPLFIKVKTVDFKSSGSDIEFSKALSRLGLFSKEPIEFNGRRIIPIDFFKQIAPKVPSPQKMKQMIDEGIIENAIFALFVEVTGKEYNQNIRIKMSAIFPDLKEITKIFPGATYISYPTGTAAYAFSKIVPKIKTAGVFPPEALSDDMRKEVMLNLEQNGIVISQQFQKK
jgi:saccharopine dehydrogenase-like NADP-dependent oxidoreductase